MVLYSEDLFKKHSEICNKLNLDSATISAAWDSYCKINKNYTLEGEPQYWLGCAIYIECKKSSAPTVGKTVIEGNLVNLTSLLRYCNLSWGHFFSNIKKWMVMAKVSDDMLTKVKLLESKFSVSCSVFKVFVKLYGEAFRIPGPQEFLQEVENAKQYRGRKSRPTPCTAVKIFEFCWQLFITLKGQDTAYSMDLVKSSELLIACLDLFFKNAFVNDQRELINPACKCEPADWCNTSPVRSAQDITVSSRDTLIDLLSRNVAEAVSATSVISIRVYELPKMLKQVLRNGEEDDLAQSQVAGQGEFIDMFAPYNLERYYKKVNTVYIGQLVRNGEIDERTLFAEHKRKISLEAQNSIANVGTEIGDNISADSPRPVGNLSDTPLTGRRFLGPREYGVDIRASLNTMLNGRKQEPTESLLAILQSCEPNPLDKIKTVVSSLGQKFVEALSDGNDAKNKLEMATKMFYKFVESLLQNEVSMNKNISLLVQRDIFYEGVFACCLEIVIHAYGYPYRFPWILKVLNIEAWNLTRVIELIIRSKDSQLSRLSIKHLSMVDESIIDHLMWKSDSQLWTTIKNSKQPIPKLEDVALPGHLVYRTQEHSSNNNVTVKNQLQSPGASAADHFQTPLNSTLSVSRQLFTNQNGHSSLPKQTHIMITNKDGNQRLIPIVDLDIKPSQLQQQTIENDSKNNSPPDPTNNKPKMGGSLALMFRKFYNLAGVRLDHLCTRLGLMEEQSRWDLIHKIWTLFQESIVNTELMRERHLDQLLMCAVYVACVLSGNQIKFSEIMKCYREQPQARRTAMPTYRNVLIRPKRIQEQDGKLVELPEERNDLIFFYNNIYIREMNRSITNLSKHGLSPLPAVRRSLPSPSIEVAKNVFVKPLESPSNGGITTKMYNYYFSRSPSKNLKDINKAINSNFVTGKRLLVDSNSDLPNKKMMLNSSANRKVQSLIEERRSQNNTE